MEQDTKPGPKTPEGKAISSQNARRHGLTARRSVIDTEELEALEALTAEYMAEWQPVGPTERDLVHELASCVYRSRRISHMESAFVNLEIDLTAESVEKIDGWDAPLASTLAYHHGAKHIDFLGRHEARLHRMARDIRIQLQQLQDRRRKLAQAAAAPKPQPAPKKCKNELPEALSINDAILAGLVPSLGPNSEWARAAQKIAKRSTLTREEFLTEAADPKDPDDAAA